MIRTMILAALLAGCSSTPLQIAMRAADTLGIAANHAEPLWISVYRREGIAAVEQACPRSRIAEQECVNLRVAASEATTRRWGHVRDQWEVAREAHSAVAICLETSDGGLCRGTAAALGHALIAYRCELRAIGHMELDLVGGPLDCATTDGGSR